MADEKQTPARDVILVIEPPMDLIKTVYTNIRPIVFGRAFEAFQAHAGSIGANSDYRKIKNEQK